MPAPIHAKVVIIGSGPAGYTAAIYAARAMLEPVLIQGIQPGGQLTITTDVENYPGFADVIQGPWLMEQMEKQARACRHQDRHRSRHQARTGAAAVPPDLRQRRRLSGRNRDPRHRRAGALARHRRRKKSSRALASRPARPATASSIAARKSIVVGGGNTAVEEALFLTNFASQVTIVHRRDHFRAERILQDRLFKNPKIKVVWDCSDRRDLRHREPRQGHPCAAEERQDRRADAKCRPTASSSPSATRRRPTSSPARSS